MSDVGEWILSGIIALMFIGAFVIIMAIVHHLLFD